MARRQQLGPVRVAVGAVVLGLAGRTRQLTQVEEALVQTETETAFDRLRLPTRLNAKLIGLIPVVAGTDAAPTDQSRAVFAKLSDEVDAQLETLEGILEEGVADFNAAVMDLKVGAVVV